MEKRAFSGICLLGKNVHKELPDICLLDTSNLKAQSSLKHFQYGLFGGAAAGLLLGMFRKRFTPGTLFKDST